MCVCVCAGGRACVHARALVYTHVCVRVCVCMHMRACVHTFACVCACAFIGMRASFHRSMRAYKIYVSIFLFN